MRVGGIRILLGYGILFQISEILIRSEAFESSDSMVERIFLLIRNSVQPSELKVVLLINSRNTRKTLRLELPAQSKDMTSLDKKIDLEKPLVFLIHGYLSDGHEKWLRRLSKAYLKQKDVNVITVNWANGAITVNYAEAVHTALKVAAELVDFINLLIDKTKVKASRIHIIGHSLGAQIAGFIGKKVSKIDRITGLDPAFPGFGANSSRLSSKDASHVDVIHTNHLLGTIDRLGQLDIYVNGGKIQPECTNNTTKSDYSKLIDMFSYNICSHSKAVSYFIESIENRKCVFVASKTTNRARRVRSKDFDSRKDSVLGLDAFKYRSNGVYHVITNNMPPYCRD